jgi:branched-chain amino acid transport system substrate-binding protein
LTYRKSITVIVLALAISLAAVAGASAAKPQITLGVVLATSGPFAGGEAPLLNGTKMAVADLNAKGGIAGRHVKIVFEDTGSSQTGAVNAYNLILSKKPVAVMDTTVSSLVLAQVPVIASGGVPTFSGAAAVLLRRDKTGLNNLYRIRTPDSIVPRAATRFALNTLKTTKIGVLYENNVTGEGWHQAIDSVLDARHLKAVDEETYAGTDVDYTPQLLRLKNAGAKAVIVFGDPANHVIIERQRKQLGLQFDLIVSNAGVLATTLSAIPSDVSEGVYGTVDSAPFAQPATKAWAARYKKTFGIDSDFSAAEYYDGVMMLAKAITRRGTAAAAVVKQLNSIRIYRGIGNIYAFAGKGDGGSGVVILKVHSGSVQVFKANP